MKITKERLRSIIRSTIAEAVHERNVPSLTEGYENIGNKLLALAGELDTISVDLSHTLNAGHEPLANRIPYNVKKRIQQLSDDIARISQALYTTTKMKGGTV